MTKYYLIEKQVIEDRIKKNIIDLEDLDSVPREERDSSWDINVNNREHENSVLKNLQSKAKEVEIVDINELYIDYKKQSIKLNSFAQDDLINWLKQNNFKIIK